MNYIMAHPRYEADGRCFVQGLFGFGRCKNKAETMADKRPVCCKHYQQWLTSLPLALQLERLERIR